MTANQNQAGERTQFNAEAPIKVDSVAIKWIADETPDLSWLDQSDAEMGEGFEAQSSERKESYGSSWEMLGCVAEAEVSRPIGQGSRRIETFKSGGLWGIESDSDRDYLRSVEDDELADLAEHLGAFGIEVTAQQLRELI